MTTTTLRSTPNIMATFHIYVLVNRYELALHLQQCNILTVIICYKSSSQLTQSKAHVEMHLIFCST